MEQSANEPSVRESRRRAAVAIAITQEHTGPIKKILGLTRKYPWPALAMAFLAGLLAARAAGRR